MDKEKQKVSPVQCECLEQLLNKPFFCNLESHKAQEPVLRGIGTERVIILISRNSRSNEYLHFFFFFPFSIEVDPSTTVISVILMSRKSLYPWDLFEDQINKSQLRGPTASQGNG